MTVSPAAGDSQWRNGDGSRQPIRGQQRQSSHPTRPGLGPLGQWRIGREVGEGGETDNGDKDRDGALDSDDDESDRDDEEDDEDDDEDVEDNEDDDGDEEDNEDDEDGDE